MYTYNILEVPSSKSSAFAREFFCLVEEILPYKHNVPAGR